MLKRLQHRTFLAAVLIFTASPAFTAGNIFDGARAILYEARNFGGRAFPIGSDVLSNLDRTGFNDRAQSLRVESGYWIFCSDANFQGDCQTFGPGDYPDLPGNLNRKISSGRMVSNRYPYSGPPSWSGPGAYGPPSGRLPMNEAPSISADANSPAARACATAIDRQIRRSERRVLNVSTEANTMRERQVSNEETGLSGSGMISNADGYWRAYTFDCIVNVRTGNVMRANYQPQ